MSGRFMKTRKQGGFSLIELLVVLVILGIIASLVVPNILGRLTGAKVKAAGAQITQLSSAIDAYYLDNGNLPDGLQDLVREPSDATFWNGPYVKEALLSDPWGREWEYKVPGSDGRMYDLYSLGADSSPGGDGENADIKSWE